MVSYIQWYHEMNNGEKQRKKIPIEFEKEEIDVLQCFRKCETAENRCYSRDSLQIQCLQGIYPALVAKHSGIWEPLTALSPPKMHMSISRTH